MNQNRIAIIGLGLIGGTLAKTIHRIDPGCEILACDPNEAPLRAAQSEQVISKGYLLPGRESITANFPAEEFGTCRYIFLCAPVEQNKSYLRLLAPYLSASCILTDTGSVKSPIHQEIKALGLSRFFLGGHPMAGSEKSGYEHATAYLFENAYYLITCGEENDPALVSEYKSFIAKLGMIPLVMSPAEHDYDTAAVSHLPHVLASELVHLVRDLDNDREDMKAIAAGGFKDITRIASSSPVMWEEICHANSTQLLLLLDHFKKDLTAIEEMIAAKDSAAIRCFFQEAKDYRDSLSIQKNGSLPGVYELCCDLIDEAGGIATIATILATNRISIKNIGIVHNREFEQGVLRIEFYEEKALKDAVALLRRHHYTIYER